jgi:lipopolysaccharide export LptBFGC system permease protein LptF
MARLIDPVLADLQCEHAEALRRSQVWRSRWICLSGYIAFSKVAVVALSRGSARTVRHWAGADDRAVGRTVLFSFIATLAWSLVFMLPPVWGAVSHPAQLVRIVLWLVPSVMSVALPMGVVFGVLCGLRGRVATRRVRWAIVCLTIVCSLAMFVNLGWILPDANQAFREMSWRQTLAAAQGASRGPVWRGMNELTIGELASGQLTRGRPPFLGTMTMTRLAFEFHFRLALAFAPLTLGLFSLGVAAARRRASGVPFIGAIALASCFAYYSLMYFARLDVSGHVPAIVAAWAPNLVFLASALLLWTLRRRGPSAADPSRRDDARQSEGRPVVPQA